MNAERALIYGDAICIHYQWRQVLFKKGAEMDSLFQFLPARTFQITCGALSEPKEPPQRRHISCIKGFFLFLAFFELRVAERYTVNWTAFSPPRR